MRIHLVTCYSTLLPCSSWTCLRRWAPCAHSISHLAQMAKHVPERSPISSGHFSLLCLKFKRWFLSRHHLLLCLTFFKIFNGRKTDQCGVILFGTEGTYPLQSDKVLLHRACVETDNVVHRKDGGYDHVTEFLHIGQPNADTLAKLAVLQTSNVAGDCPCSNRFHAFIEPHAVRSC